MAGWIMVGALSMFLSVALGAFGAHGLKGKIAEDLLAVYETGVHYQMIHGLAILLVALLMGKWSSSTASLGWANGSFLIGTLLFSGSLYLLALTGVRALGAVTPFGGIAFLLGWLLLAWAAWNNTR